MLVACACSTAAAQTLIYSDSSSESAGRLESRMGVALDASALALGANVTLVDENGRTQVLPRITSDWSGLGGVDVETVFAYGDWNLGGDAYRPTVDTRLRFRAPVAFVERIEGDVRRGGADADETLKLDFSGLDTGWALLGGNALNVRADLTVSEEGERPDAVSTIVSSVGVGRAVDLESDLHLDALAADGGFAPSLDTRLVYRQPLPFVQRIEGSASRDAAGQGRDAVSVLFPNLSGAASSPLRLGSKATLEEAVGSGAAAVLRMGVETTLSGFATPLLGGTNALSLTLERTLDADRAQRSSVAYDHSWSPGRRASIGLDLKLVAEPDQLEPSMGVKWLAQF